MSAVITKELAQKISKKLEAREKNGKKHDIACIYYKGKQIASFGIRRGSNKDSGHDYVSEQLFITKREARLLGECPLSRDQWLEIIEKKGKLPT